MIKKRKENVVKINKKLLMIIFLIYYIISKF